MRHVVGLWRELGTGTLKKEPIRDSTEISCFLHSIDSIVIFSGPPNQFHRSHLLFLCRYNRISKTCFQSLHRLLMIALSLTPMYHPTFLSLFYVCSLLRLYLSLPHLYRFLPYLNLSLLHLYLSLPHMYRFFPQL